MSEQRLYDDEFLQKAAGLSGTSSEGHEVLEVDEVMKS